MLMGLTDRTCLSISASIVRQTVAGALECWDLPPSFAHQQQGATAEHAAAA